MSLKIVRESEPIKVERINLCIYGGLGRGPPSAQETWLGLRSVLAHRTRPVVV